MASPAATQLTVERFLQQVQTLQKQAGTYEPGSIGGPTEHPSRTVDSNTHDKKEGARSAENNKDVKEQVGAPLAIVGEGEQPKAAIDSIPTPGLRAAATGEDPQNETQRAKRTKDDNAGQRLGRTTHPARADNPGLDSIKYAELSIEEHAKIAMDLGNRVLAGLSVRLNEPETPQETKEAVDAAAQVGWELAGLVDSGFDKQALDRQVHLALEDMIKSASDDADLVVEYLASFEQTRAQEAQAKQAQDRVRQTRSKQANMGGMPPEAAGGMPPGAEGGMPPDAGGMPPGAEG
jgi:hypothetical protein